MRVNTATRTCWNTCRSASTAPPTKAASSRPTRALADILGYQNTADLWQVNVNDFYIKRKARLDHMNRLATALTDFREFELRVKGGKSIWVRDYPRAVLGPDGRIQYFDGILVDVTERKAAEEALLQSEKDYRQLFENAHDAIFIFTIRDEIILDVNNRACELYGFEPHRTDRYVIGKDKQRYRRRQNPHQKDPEKQILSSF